MSSGTTYGNCHVRDRCGDSFLSKHLGVFIEPFSLRIHVKLIDPSTPRSQVPESVFLCSGGDFTSCFSVGCDYTMSPFSFSIYPASTSEMKCFSLPHLLQYLRVKTHLLAIANHLSVDNTTLALWSRNSYGIPVGTNLYGNYPVYSEHRTSGTHEVLLLSSNGIDIKLNKTDSGRPSLNVEELLIFYFLVARSEK